MPLPPPRLSPCLPFVAAVLLTACGSLRPADGTPAPLPAALLVPGVSSELARLRAATLSGVRYTLELDVTRRDTAVGRVSIAVDRGAGAGDLVLDFRGTAVHEVTANGAVVPDARWERDHIILPTRHLRAGSNELVLRFSSPIAAAGAAVIAYDDVQDDARYLYTLLVPSDAQLLFPVFDQPDIKARFSWRVITPPDWHVLTNGSLLSRTPHGGGTLHVFDATLPISTYTAAFAAGPWQVLRDSVRTPAGSPADVAARDASRDMELWVRRTGAAEVDADTLLRLNRDALRWLEDYFAMPYPFGKLDILLAPAFPFGGMEHVGAIFYNETTFIFREPPTLTRRLSRAATIYHEVAHQWFGDLVTMRWFDDLWLKEGFSTFMAARIQDSLHPGTEAWKTFYLRNKPLAYGVDVTSGTTPVWQDLPNLDLAKGNYGPIVYNKAPSILKQLEFLVGEAAFRSGLQRFLRRHAYANATWRDLLDDIGHAAGADLGDFGSHYILRAGAPLIDTRLDVSDGVIRELVLSQRPARALAGDPGGAWPGRVRVRLGYTDREDVVLDVAFTGAETRVDAARGRPAPAFVFPNDGDFGYGIFLPDPASAEWLLVHAHTLTDGLLRAMAWGALWDLVREERLPAARFAAAALRAWDAERDEQIAGVLLGRITYALERYVAPGAARDSLAGELERRLLARVADERLEYGLRRAALDALLGSARSAAGITALQEYLAGSRSFNDAPLGQPSRWAAVTRLLALGHPNAPALLRAEQARDSTPEAARMAFIAGAAVPTAENRAAYFARYFEDASLNEEWATASLGAFNHQLHAELSLPYLPRALQSAEWLRDNRRIFFLPRWLDAFIGGHASPEALRIVDDYLAATPSLPDDVRRRILQARDELERAVRIRASNPTGQP